MRKLLLLGALALTLTSCTPRWVEAQFPGTHRPESARIARDLTHYVDVWIGARYAVAVAQHSCSGPSTCVPMVRSLASRYGVSPDGAVNVMMCESGGSPTASNGGRYLGLFQQSADYWSGRASAYGHPGASAFDGYANADVSMQMVRDGGWGPWECQP